MVMSKVSKAVAASFFCLTINAGGVTNAMDMENPNSMRLNTELNNMNMNIESENEFNFKSSSKRILDNDINNIETNKKITIRDDETSKTNETKADDKKDGEKAKDGKEAPDGEKSIWRWLLPVITGVGGFTVGTILGKFAF